MTNDLHAIARLAAPAAAAEPTAASARAAAGNFVTTVRRADEIPSFETVVKRTAEAAATGAAKPAENTAAASPSNPNALAPAKKADKARKSFEAFALQVFIGSMLPKENTKMFGTGSAGKMWQAMLAEKLADQIAASGRLKLLPEQPAGTPVAAPAAPAADNGMTTGSNAAFQARAIGLKPGRAGGT